jgi:glycosyltransferase involved in cell wall biosynthesis
MKVLVLCYEYPPLGGGGGRVAKTVAEQLAARGHEVRVQTAGMSHLPTRETIGGVEVFRTRSFRRHEDRCSVSEMGLFCLTSFRPTLRHCREWKPDVIHAHFAMPTGVLAWAVHRRTRVPYVLTAHLGDVPGGVPEQTDRLFQLVAPVARRVWKQAAAVTAVSSFVQELAERAYARKVELIFNGIDLSDAPAPPETVATKRHLVFVGRFNPQKCPLFLIDVLAGLQDLDWRLTMIGDGILLKATRHQAEFYKLTSRIYFAGWLAEPGVQRIVRTADVLMMPSNSEGQPVAAIEALKYGLAIAASDIPGVRDVVLDGVNGARIPRGDLPAWTAGLRTLLTDNERLIAMKRASWEKARDFDLAIIASRYEQVLLAAGRH